jgi:hypothetical protein
MNASVRFILVICIIVLAAGMVLTAGMLIHEFTAPLPSSCADSSGPSSMAPAECHRSISLYVFALLVLGGGVGALWRKLGK